MERELKSASEIQSEVQRMIDLNREVIEDGGHVKATRPRPYAQPDASGCNWNIEIFQNPVGHEGAARRAVEAVQQKWNLR